MDSMIVGITANMNAEAFRDGSAPPDPPREPESVGADADGPGLRESTATWIEALPNSVRPRELGERYPWITNKLCALWNQPGRCTRYLADLLIARGGSRDGFAPKVAREISGLRLHYATLHPRERGWTDSH